MEGTMKDKVVIPEEFTELLNGYYDGSFSQMACDYIRFMGMTNEEVEELLETMRLVICINTL
jgi:hypothetical protein